MEYSKIGNIPIELPPQVTSALQRLTSCGYSAYVVGGAVRDCIMGIREAGDWDITTSALPAQVEAAFSDCRVIATGKKHGTVTVLLSDMPLEITTYRVDGAYSDRRHPDGVQFTASLREDLARRDFTMNALAYHPAQGLVDCFGGREDLQKGIIRCVGDPDTRLQEDALRILRALRFASVFGMEIEAETAAAIHRGTQRLSHVSAERIRSELTRLLCGKNVRQVLLAYPDVVTFVLPELAPMVGFEQHSIYHCFDVWAHTAAVVEAVEPEPALRWAALLHDAGKPSCFSLEENGTGHFYGHAEKSAGLAEEILRRLKFENAVRMQIVFLVKAHDLRLSQTERSVRRAIQRFGRERLLQLIALGRADSAGHSACCQFRLAESDALKAMVQELSQGREAFSRKDLAVNGNDLLALGYRGRQLSAALELLVEAVALQDCQNEKQILLTRLQEEMPPQT